MESPFRGNALERGGIMHRLVKLADSSEEPARERAVVQARRFEKEGPERHLLVVSVATDTTTGL